MYQPGREIETLQELPADHVPIKNMPEFMYDLAGAVGVKADIIVTTKIFHPAIQHDQGLDERAG
jgi:hypothetical protein